MHDERINKFIAIFSKVSSIVNTRVLIISLAIPIIDYFYFSTR